MMTNPKFYCAGGVLLLLLGLMFCFSGGNADAPVEVAGIVYLDGKPLPNAEVFFVEDAEGALQADGSPQRTHGRTDETGRYELILGVMPGSYRVVVRALVGGDQQAMVPGLGSDGVDIAQLEAAASAVEISERTANYGYRNRRTGIATPKPLPPVYSSAEQTVLRIGVPKNGTETADLQLSLDRVAAVNHVHN